MLKSGGDGSSDLLFPVTKKMAFTPALSRWSNIMPFHSLKAYPGILFVIPSSNVKLMAGCTPATDTPARKRRMWLTIFICDNLAKRREWPYENTSVVIPVQLPISGSPGHNTVSFHPANVFHRSAKNAFVILLLGLIRLISPPAIPILTT